MISITILIYIPDDPITNNYHIFTWRSLPGWNGSPTTAKEAISLQLNYWTQSHPETDPYRSGLWSSDPNPTRAADSRAQYNYCVY